MKKVLLVWFMGVIMISCGKKFSIDDIAGKEFRLTNPLGEYNITITIEKDGSMSGFSGVNRYFGPVEIKDGKITTGNIAGTMMAGSEESMRAEGEYKNLLSQVDALEYKSGKLTITTNNGEKLEFQENN